MLYVHADCRDDMEVLDANSVHFGLRPISLPRSILLNSDIASPTPVDTELPVVMVFNLTTSLKIRFIQTSMWATNIARVTAELRQYDDPRYEPTLRVFSVFFYTQDMTRLVYIKCNHRQLNDTAQRVQQLLT